MRLPDGRDVVVVRPLADCSIARAAAGGEQVEAAHTAVTLPGDGDGEFLLPLNEPGKKGPSQPCRVMP